MKMDLVTGACLRLVAAVYETWNEDYYKQYKVFMMSEDDYKETVALRRLKTYEKEFYTRLIFSFLPVLPSEAITAAHTKMYKQFTEDFPVWMRDHEYEVSKRQAALCRTNCLDWIDIEKK